MLHMLGPLLAAVLLAPSDLPALGKAPVFRVTDQDGRPFASASLSGKVWVADFIFTTCKDVCPGMTRVMRQAQRRLGHSDELAFASLSVDPVRDTPVRLKSFALQHGADLGNWSFLTTGNEPAMVKLARAFKIHAGIAADNPYSAHAGHGQHAHHAIKPPVTHGRHFVLVDRKGEIRGFYRPDDDGLDRLVADTRVLLGE
ncbi:MAG: SCO family protein [Candidatus Sericytochromatia bacterium]|nr:SCO family protein [Candidatus Sericytochromatia bacterium]